MLLLLFLHFLFLVLLHGVYTADSASLLLQVWCGRVCARTHPVMQLYRLYNEHETTNSAFCLQNLSISVVICSIA